MDKANGCIERRSDCAISVALDAIGDKWSLLILRDLMFNSKRSYTELQACEEGIATNILASRLQKLEEQGIVRKTHYPANARRSQYFLTEKGIDLFPVMLELTVWMMKHDKVAHACSEMLTHMQTDKEAFVKRGIERLRQEHLAEVTV